MTNIFMRVTLFLANLTSVSGFLLKGRTFIKHKPEASLDVLDKNEIYSSE